jgi:hypothetical protein
VTRGDVRAAAYVVMSGCGALLVTLPAERYRIDAVRCADWPSPSTTWPLWLGYVAGIALLTVAWLGIAARVRRLGVVLLAGLIPHIVALASPMFLSEDPLYYAALGHAQATRNGDPRLPLSAALPPTDPFLQHVQPAWRDLPSAYERGFDALTEVVDRVADDDLNRALWLYQLLGAACMLATAALTARAVERARANDDPSLHGTPGAAGEGARAAALVLFCPLAVVEGTLSGHNDALLAVSVALSALALAERRRGWAVVALASGLLVKDSAILLLLLLGLTWLVVATRLDARSRRAQLTFVLGLIAAAAVVVAALLPAILRRSPTVRSLLTHGSGGEFCVRSVECLPRALLFWLLHLPTTAFAVNLAFRAAAVAWLGYVAWRAARDRRYLRWAATFLLFYYLYLHAFSQSWYLLSLLPLAPYLHPALRRPAAIFLVSLVAYYPIDVAWSCGSGGQIWRWALVHVSEGLIVIAPATVSLLGNRRARLKAAFSA